MDSLYRGYPSGTILVWETDQDVPERELAVPQQANEFANHKLLLDGQQRLTALSAIVRGLPLKLKRARPIEIAFNLAHPEGHLQDVQDIEDDVESDDEEEDDEESETNVVLERAKHLAFIVAWKGLYKDPHWVRVSDVFKGEKTDWQILKPLGLTPEAPEYDLYSKRLQRLRGVLQYPYVMHLLDRSLSYEEVAEIFVRVNSLGMKLRGSDLALALVTARWPTSLKLLEAAAEQFEDVGFAFDLGLLVRAMVVFATKQSRFRTIGRVSVERLQVAWENAKSSLEYAVNFLRSNAGIEDLELLSSPLFVIPVAVLASQNNRHLTATNEKLMRQWVVVASALGHYSASSETTLDADLSMLFSGRGPAGLLELLRQQQGGRLRVTAKDFEARSARNPLFATTYLALRQAGAKDWATGLAISLTHTGKAHALQTHHIFPRSLMKGADRKHVNEIANLAFVGGGTNRAFANKSPDKYLPSVVAKQGPDALNRQCVPIDSGLWTVEQFEAFLERRRAMLADAVNDYFDAIAGHDDPALDIGELVSGGESSDVEFKETLRVNVKRPDGSLDRDEKMEREVIKSVAGFMNAHGGKVVIGVTDKGAVTGLSRDYASLGDRKDADGFQQTLQSLLSAAIGKPNATQVKVKILSHENKDICLLEVPSSSVPVYATLNGTQSFFARSGPTTQSLEMADAHAYIKKRFS